MATQNPILAQAPAAQTKQAPATPSPDSGSRVRAIEEALAQSTADLKEAKVTLEQGTRRSTVAQKTLAEAIPKIGAANQAIALQRDTAALQTQNANIAAFEAAGGIERQTDLFATLREDQNRVADLLDEKQEILGEEHTGIQIIDAVINTFSSVSTDFKLEAAQAQQQQTANSIQAVNTATESTARSTAITQKTLNAGVIEANQQKIAAQTSVELAKTEIANVGTNATAMNQVFTLDSRNIANLMKVFELEGAAEARTLRRETQAFQREQMEFQREKWLVQLPAAQTALEQAQLQLEETKLLTGPRRSAAMSNFQAATKRFTDLLATEEQIVRSIQEGQSSSGTTIEPRETIIWGLSQGGETSDKYIRLQEIGGTPSKALGLSPFEARESLNTVAPAGNHRVTVGTRLLKQISSLQAAKDAQAAGQGIKPSKDPEVLKAAYNQTAAEFMTINENEIKTGDMSNPFHAPPMTVLSGTAAVQSTALYQKVLKPMQMKETNPQKIFDAAISGVAAGTLAPEEAASGIKAIFDTAAAYNNELDGGFTRVGLDPQTTYNSTLELEAFGFFEKVRENLAFQTQLVTGALTAPTKKAGDIIEGFQAPEFLFLPVDLLDETQVQSTIVKLLSRMPPIETKPENQGGEQ